MDFKLRHSAIHSSNDDLIDDLKRVAKLLGKNIVSKNEYDEHGRFSSATLFRRLGGWENASRVAGLQTDFTKYISNEELFENLEFVWRSLSRQPFAAEMRKPLSKYDRATYLRRFGNWQKACETFIKHKQGDVEFIKMAQTTSIARSRNINGKDRLKVLNRRS